MTEPAPGFDPWSKTVDHGAETVRDGDLAGEPPPSDDTTIMEDPTGASSGPSAQTRVAFRSTTQAIPPAVVLEIQEASADPSRRFGRYLMLGKIGGGGMGVVHRAFDPEIRRVVALKLLLPRAGVHADDVERFQREASSAGRLGHPSVIRVFDVGRADDRPYIVMDYIDGGTLEDLIKRSDGRLRGLITLLADVASALAHAHAQGIAHRDVKPANILIASAEGHVRPVLTDFGLALDAASERLTTTGTILGSPSYMAPEQVDAQPDRIGPPVDVWALGVILHEIVAGARPFRSDELVKIFHQILEAEPADPRESRPDAPGPLAELAGRCLAKDREARPTAAEVAEALTEWLGDPSAGLAAPAPATDEDPTRRLDAAAPRAGKRRKSSRRAVRDSSPWTRAAHASRSRVAPAGLGSPFTITAGIIVGLILVGAAVAGLIDEDIGPGPTVRRDDLSTQLAEPDPGPGVEPVPASSPEPEPEPELVARPEPLPEPVKEPETKPEPALPDPGPPEPEPDATPEPPDAPEVVEPPPAEPPLAEVDTTAPELGLLAELPDFHDGSRLTIEGRLSEPGCTLEVDGKRVKVADDGAWQAKVRIDARRPTPIEIVATDAAGNETRLERTVVSSKLKARTGPGKAWWSPTRTQTDAARSKGWPLWFESPTIGMRFVLVPGPKGKPFYVGETEVSWAQYARKEPGTERRNRRQTDDHPVMYRTGEQAEAFCQWLGEQDRDEGRYRLPSAEEWGYAARAGTTTRWFWGDDPGGALGFASVLDRESPRFAGGPGDPFPIDDGEEREARVAAIEPNPWGLRHTIGNVAEICRGPEGFVAMGGSYREGMAGCLPEAITATVPARGKGKVAIGFRPIAARPPK